MDTDAKEQKDPATQPESPHKHVAGAVGAIAAAACFTMILGAMMGAAWPAAVAACGLCLMGVGVAYFMRQK